MKQTVLVTGAGGQLGRELVCGADFETDTTIVAVTRSQLDIGDAQAVSGRIGELAPQLVINAAAYTAVDRAESEPDAANRVNAQGPHNLALACRDVNARLIHISTDFVYNGESSCPYRTDSPPAPVSEYGRSKLAGDRAVLSLLPQALIIRTGWVYSRYGHNFVNTMLRLMAQRDELAVVADQVGTPTWASGLARAIRAASAREELSGVYHWSDAGVCSWYDFAVAVSEEACEIGLLSDRVKIRPIGGSSYPTPARRPAYSVLDKDQSWSDFELEGVHWRVQLRAMLQELKEQGNE